jgi:hypothetical protein
MLQTKHRPAVTVAAAALLAFLVSSLLGLVPIISYALGGFTPGTDIGYVASQIGYDLATQGIPFGLGVYIVLAIFRAARRGHRARGAEKLGDRRRCGLRAAVRGDCRIRDLPVRIVFGWRVWRALPGIFDGGQ